MNKNIIVGILEAILEINNDPSMPDVGISQITENYEWRDLCKYINRYGAVTLLDSMTSDDIKEISYDFLIKNR